MNAVKMIDRVLMDAGIWADVEETEEFYLVTIDGDWIESHHKAEMLIGSKFLVPCVDCIVLEEHECDEIRATEYKAIHFFSKMI